MEYKREKLANGDIKITLSFVAKARESAILSKAGGMLIGFKSGFVNCDTAIGDKINVLYGYNLDGGTGSKEPITILK